MEEWKYVDDKLINGKGQSVMMGWEKPIMKKWLRLFRHLKVMF